MNTLDALILGAVEGVTEFLPISSTAHLVLANYFLNNDITNSFTKVFEISIQLGAILSVLVYYFKEFLKLENIKLLLVGVMPTLVIGFLAKDTVNKLLEIPMLIAVNLILGGVLILVAEYIYRKRKSKQVSSISYKESAIIGVIQSIAMAPGVSRSGAIIVYGLFKNFEREVIAKYAFLLAVPTMFAATGYSMLKNRELLLHNGNFVDLSVGFFSAFLVALLVVKYAIPFIKKYSFAPFAYYRIILGIILILSI
jgi:undecaprenyl-diphosphatase